jgi:antitoxin component YwqK of YwqJK toxin-antitoxin module
MKQVFSALVFLIAFNSSAQDFTGPIDRILLSEYRNKIVGEGTTKEGLKEGKWVFYTNREAGIKYSEGMYLAGRKMGNWKTYRPSQYGKIKTKEIHRNDSLFRLTYFIDTGEKGYEMIAEKGLSVAASVDLEKVCYHLPAITIALIGRVDLHVIREKCLNLFAVALRMHKSNATLKHWDTDGALIESRTIENGTDYRTLYAYQAGMKIREDFFINDTLQQKKYLLQGSKTNFELQLYYSNGQLKEKQTYVNTTLKTGKWTTYFPSGKKKAARAYKKDQLHGSVKEWDEAGNLTKKETYKNGTLVE